ncbi:MAG TPA: PSD1 and planctomycete cytochrome C domain-containing protein [Bryobacteraceae bacterium]|nr:PSD1 and planctomycete cytochrome C domain-containing protein [Bryobacteraceae bacterium]
MRGKLFCLAVFATAMQLGAETPGAEFFENKIRPVLATNCYGCHSSKLKSPMGGLVLDTKTGVLNGGNSGPILVAGKPDASLLMRVLRYNDVPKMPPAGKLPDNVVKDFEQWIAAGAPDPRTVTTTPGASAGGPRVIDFAQGRKWWAFQPVREIPAPKAKNEAWVKSKIDAFILAKLESNGLKPSPEADSRTLVRRVYVDLVGYKPSYEEVESYANDQSPDKYAKLIDRLLASPQYGERWARYWLDVSRYAEDGLAGAQYAYAWRYRDWVIDAFNKDVPYNKFLKLQLAADQMPDASRADLAALGFSGLGPVEHKEFKLSKDVIEGLMLDEWDERLDAVSRGMLGLTVGCARCHDHKFDPITTKDYYAMAGVFASTASAVRPLAKLDPETEKRFIWARQRYTDLQGGITNLSGNKDIDQKSAAEKIALYKAEQDKLRPELEAIRDQHPELADLIEQTLSPKKGGGGRGGPSMAERQAPFVNAVYDAGLWLDGSHPDYTMEEFKPGTPHDLPVYFRGTGGTGKGTPVARSFLTVLSTTPGKTFTHGSGRLDLAEAIVTDAAPLTARVFVNRVWGESFGAYLVGTPSDFGDRGDKPTHPELLNDLAARFIAHGWSIKWLQREILLSSAYRQASHPRADGMEKDETNRLLWRMNPRRLDIEAYRDTMLRSAGILDLKMYGPSVDLEEAGNYRRTLYAKISRARLNDLLRIYDFPSPMQHSPSRVDTMTPLQQLFVMNSPFIENLATSLANSVEQEQGAAKIRDLYRKILSRDPSPAEIDSALTYLGRAPLARVTQTMLATTEEIFWP